MTAFSILLISCASGAMNVTTNHSSLAKTRTSLLTQVQKERLKHLQPNELIATSGDIVDLKTMGESSVTRVQCGPSAVTVTYASAALGMLIFGIGASLVILASAIKKSPGGRKPLLFSAAKWATLLSRTSCLLAVVFLYRTTMAFGCVSAGNVVGFIVFAIRLVQRPVPVGKTLVRDTILEQTILQFSSISEPYRKVAVRELRTASKAPNCPHNSTHNWFARHERRQFSLQNHLPKHFHSVSIAKLPQPIHRAYRFHRTRGRRVQVSSHRIQQLKPILHPSTNRLSRSAFQNLAR